jgi:hypothetical protein
MAHVEMNARARNSRSRLSARVQRLRPIDELLLTVAATLLLAVPVYFGSASEHARVQLVLHAPDRDPVWDVPFRSVLRCRRTFAGNDHGGCLGDRDFHRANLHFPAVRVRPRVVPILCDPDHLTAVDSYRRGDRSLVHRL